MADDDFRVYQTYYGIHVDDWAETFGSFANHHKLLVKEYINEGCSCTTSSIASDTNEFLYPHFIKEIYFIEGVIEGHVTFASSGCTSILTDYRVTVCKVHENTAETELFSTGWVIVNDTLGWNAVDGIPSIIAGEEGEMVYPFWIDAWQHAELSDGERIFLKIETHITNCGVLWNSNDSTWEDVKITIPFKM